MRRRLDLAASLVGRPRVIFLDEPTTGLDPAKREDMWEVVRGLVTDGSTVLLTTQYLDEADALADEISVIDHGRVIAHDTPDGLKRTIGGQRIRSARPTATRLRRRAADPRRDRRHRAPKSTGPRPAHRRRRRRGGARRHRRPAAAERHRRHRTVPAPAVAGRGLPDPHRRTGHRRRHPTTTKRRRRHDAPQTAITTTRRHAAHRIPPAAAASTARGGYLRHVIALAKRSLIKMWRTPEALIDVTLQPIIFLLLFTYIFGGAIAGGSQADYLQFLLPGLLGQSIAMAGVALGQNLNADIEKGVFDRFRSLPIGRSVPLVGAVIADIVPLPDPLRRHPRVRHDHGLPDRDQCRGGHRRRSASPSPSRCASAGSRCSSG